MAPGSPIISSERHKTIKPTSMNQIILVNKNDLRLDYQTKQTKQKKRKNKTDKGIFNSVANGEGELKNAKIISDY